MESPERGDRENQSRQTGKMTRDRLSSSDRTKRLVQSLQGNGHGKRKLKKRRGQQQNGEGKKRGEDGSSAGGGGKERVR